MTKVYDNATDLITFARSSSGTALRRVGYGDELVTNGTFDTDTVWTKVNATITGGEGVLDGTGGLSMIYQDIVTNGKHYEVTFDAVVTTGSMEVINNDGIPLKDIYTTGTYTFTFTHSIANGNLLWRCPSGSNSGSIDNISVREVIFDRATDPLVLFNHLDDTPRIEYGSDGALKGLLIEEQRTNLATYSEDFSNAEWASTQSGLESISVSSETSPDGLTNAYEIVEDDTATVHYFQDNISGLSATSYTLSLFARQGSGTRYLQLRSGGGGVFANFDLSAGNVVNSGGAYILQANIEDFGNNWYRCSVAGDFAVAPSAYQIILSNSTGAAPSYTGDGTSSILIYGAQLEEGSFPTSYIPTSGSQQTRSADVASIPVTAFGYNQDAGSLFVEWERNGITSAVELAASLNPVSPGAYVAIGGVSSWYNTGVATTGLESGINKLAVSFNSDGGFSSTYNAAAVQTSSSSDWTGGSTTLRIGDRTGTDRTLNGHIKSLKYYPRRLTDTQLQELTA